MGNSSYGAGFHNVRVVRTAYSREDVTQEWVARCDGCAFGARDLPSRQAAENEADAHILATGESGRVETLR